MTADDPGEGLRAVGISNDEVGGFELVLPGVERIDLFARFRVPDLQLMSREFVVIEHMARVSELERDEVGDVHHIVDRALTERFDRLDEPFGGWTDLHIADQSSGEERAHIRDAVDELEFIADRGAEAHLGEFGHFQRSAVLRVSGSRDFSRDPDMTEAIASIGGNLDIQDNITVVGRLVLLDRHPRFSQDVVGFLRSEVRRGKVLIQPAQ